MEGVRGGCGSGVYVSAEVGSLPAINSRNVSSDRSGSEEGVTIFGAFFVCFQIGLDESTSYLTSNSLHRVLL